MRLRLPQLGLEGDAPLRSMDGPILTFRASIPLPAGVPAGTYDVEVLDDHAVVVRRLRCQVNVQDLTANRLRVDYNLRVDFENATPAASREELAAGG